MNDDNNQMPQFTPPPSHGRSDTDVMSTKDWVITYLIMMIPCVGIIMSFVWAFSGSGNLNRRNYCRAFLIIIAIIIVLYLLLILIFGAAMFSLVGLNSW